VIRDTRWREKAVTAAEAVGLLRSGHRVFVQGAAATPTELLEALCARTDLEGVELYHLHTNGPAPFADPSVAGRLHSNSLFVGPPLRDAVREGRADFVPIFLSDIPDAFRSRAIPLDVAILSLSPPDRHGNCTLGTSVDAARAAADCASVVIAVVNERMPRTHGDTVVPLDRVDAFVLADRRPWEVPHPRQNDVDHVIGAIIADLVEDGATLQVGIGGIPDAVLSRLGAKHDLGVHTETFSDGLLDLLEKGVVTNRLKNVHRGRTVTSFVCGTARLYDYVDDNSRIEFHACDRTNDVEIIRMNPKVVAINSAIEVDLTGQVCADSIGHRIYSGIGGQMDFLRGAARSKGGKPIIALPSTAAHGSVSRIVAELKPGAGVVTTRGDVHWVVTEYGAVNLHGLPLRRRAEALISIAHPDFRADLRRQASAIRHFALAGDAPRATSRRPIEDVIVK
jgi:acyl-CoA hydrolase